MIETDVTGDSQLDALRKNKSSGAFNDWEQRFISDVAGKKYSALSKHQKAVVSRLYGWLVGQ